MTETEKMQNSMAQLVATALETTFPALAVEVVIEDNRITVMNAVGVVYEIYVEKC